MLNNNIQKNTISKAKSQLFIQKRRSREELANLSKSQRSSIYDHRSRYAKLNKAKRIARFLVSGSKNISFYLLMTVPTEKKRKRSKVKYIYNNNITTKRVTTDFKYMDLQKKGVYGMSNFATLNVNKILNNGIVEPDFVERKTSDNAYYATSDRVKNAVNSIKTRHSIQAETKKPEQEMRSNVSAYKTYVHHEKHIPALSQEEAFKKIVEIANQPFFGTLPKEQQPIILKDLLEEFMTEKWV